MQLGISEKVITNPLVSNLKLKTIDRLTDLRIRQNREFFNVAPQIALDIFRDIALTVDDAIVLEYHDNKPILPTSPAPPPSDDTPKAPRRGRFKFSMVGIKIGELVTFLNLCGHNDFVSKLKF